jgi:hypothetical protein
VPPPLPPRYRLEIRLGRDEDIEEWLATDISLDRPVLIRVLGPETSPKRQERFLADHRAAARVAHTHVASVYTAGPVEGGAYAVTEWSGGVTLEDRMRADERPDIAEFLSNAAGLADGLAALHDDHVVHGSIDPSSISYARAHPAKLASFGRRATTWTPLADVQSLGATLETVLTGQPAGVLPPSQMIDGVPAELDRVLRAAQGGQLSAHQLADHLRSVPYSAPPEPARTWSWKWLAPVAVLAVLAIGIALLGNLLDAGPDSPVLFPASPAPSTTQAVSDSTTTTQPTTTSTEAPPADNSSDPTAPPEGVEVVAAFAYDPLGDGSERDADVVNLTDGDPDTTWRTERYFDPLPLLKSGVGVAFEVRGSAGEIEIDGMSEGTLFAIRWAETLPTQLDGWQQVASGTAISPVQQIQLPSRSGGFWLIWLTNLPPQDEGYFSTMRDVRFLP